MEGSSFSLWLVKQTAEREDLTEQLKSDNQMTKFARMKKYPQHRRINRKPRYDL